MWRAVTIVLAIALLLSGAMAPSADAASDLGSRASKGCSPAKPAAAHSCCCGHAPATRCPCEVAPSTPRPQPIEGTAAERGIERPVAALVPSTVALRASARPGPVVLERFGRHGHIASVGPRLHLLEGVFRE